MVRQRRGGHARHRSIARALRAAAREPRPMLLLEIAEAGPLTPSGVHERRPELTEGRAEAARHLEAMWRAGLVRPRGTAEDAVTESPYVLSRLGEHVALLARQLL